MPVFLFWNVQGKPLGPMVERLAAAHAVDVIVLAEGERVEVLPGFKQVADSGDRVRLFDRTGADWQLVDVSPLSYWAGYRVVPQTGLAYTLFAAHLPSKLRATADDQRSTLAVFRDAVLNAESEYGERTLIVGDLNCDPFEPGIAGVDGLNAVSSMAVARRATRTFQGRSYKLLYNPMWGVFGDRTPGPPGTYFRTARGALSYYWNVFDQVLLRPALMDALSDLQAMTEVEGESLMTKPGLPADDGSDHLPLLFRLDW